ncbi:MAG TPA: hypothetical protein VGN65_01335 [Casimicrobiaceae bacterium]|jgi:hypothetical protein
MKNKLTDLNDHLFAQIERLSEDKLTPENIASEVQRATTIVEVADRIVSNARLQLDAYELAAKHRDLFPNGMPLLARRTGDAQE